MEEIWRPFREGLYEASNLGRIRRTRTKRVMRGTVDRDGYRWVCLSLNGKKKIMFVHCIVAEVFHGVKPSGLQVNHRSTVKSNNKEKDLEYMTPKQNAQHALQNGLYRIGERHPKAILTENDVRRIRALYRSGSRICDLARTYGILWESMAAVVKRKNWRHIL